MKPDKATVYEVFQLEKRYVVPLYQRPYVWKEDEHWTPLWDDIEAKAVALARNESTAPHFLGAIVLSQIKVALRQISASQVIDGQQRLTTLQIILAVFRDVVGELAAKEAEPVGHLYKEYKTWWESQKHRAVSDILDELNQYSSAYRSFQEPSRLAKADSRLATLAKRIRVLDT